MGAKLFIGTPRMGNEGVFKKIWFGLCEIAWFLWQPIANLRRGSVYKITHISAVTYPRTTKLNTKLKLRHRPIISLLHMQII